MAQDIESVQRALLVRIRTEGIVAAYEAALAVCRDPKAPAPARATAATTLFRVGGLFADRDQGQEKQPHEMTAQELAAEIARLSAEAAELSAGNAPADIFE